MRRDATAGTRPNQLTYRGVSYDTGSNFATGQGALSRVVWSSARMQEEIAAIKEDLHANSVTVYGSDLGRMFETVGTAVDHGLHVWLQPRLVDRPQGEIIAHLEDGARLAETFRRRGADIRFSIGCVHGVQTPGIVPGEKYHNRMANLYADVDHHFLRPTHVFDPAQAWGRLNEFLGITADRVRGLFKGEITYSAGPFEDVDWSIVDHIGLTYYYSYHPTVEGYAKELGAYRRWGKPIHIAEYGTPTYAGAAARGLMAFDVVDRAKPKPTVFEGVVRDESAQAEFHLRMLGMFEDLGITGAAMAEFIHPTHPHSADPLYDLDVASMAITKTIRDDYDDWASEYRWEPKESFRAIASFYAARTAREQSQAA